MNPENDNRTNNEILLENVRDVYGDGFYPVYMLGDFSHDEYVKVKPDYDNFVVVRRAKDNSLYCEEYVFPSEIPAGISEEELIAKSERATLVARHMYSDELVEILENYIFKYYDLKTSFG